MCDSAEPEVSEDDLVILRHVSDDMVSGLPTEEAEFIRSMSGQIVIVSEAGQESVEVMMTDPASGTIHFLRVTGDDLLRHVE